VSAAPSISRTEQPNTNHKAGSISQLFGAAVKAALTQEDEAPAPTEKRRRKGETEGAFNWLARIVSRVSTVRRSFRQRAAITSRYAPIDPEACAVATKYLSSALDTLQQLSNDPGTDYSGTFNPVSNNNSLHL
jgi:hypothetical protein